MHVLFCQQYMSGNRGTLAMYCSCVVYFSILFFVAMEAAPNDSGGKYRKVLKEIFLGNKLSAQDTQRLSMASSLAGAAGVTDFARAGSHGTASKNIMRDLMRKITKDSDYPPYYWADIPVYDAKKQQTIIVSLPFLLPHEVLHSLFVKGKLGNATSTRENCSKALWKHLRDAASMTDRRPQDIFAVGLHGDGTPCGANESLEQLSWSLPCWLGEGFGPRFLIFATLKCFMVKHETWNAVFEVIAWSFKCLFGQSFPDSRHDGAPWAATDKQRSSLSGALGAMAILCHCRGDWAFFKEVFNFPAWNARDSMCWMCNANKETMKDGSQSAPWRSHRKGPNDLLRDLRAQGIRPCPLFSIPLFHVLMVLVDWLHTMDIGVTATVLGSFFFECLAYLPGGNRKEKVASLWERMRNFYDRHPLASKLDSLTVDMIKQDQKKPKLRGKASQVKALVPFALELAQQYFTAGPHNNTVKAVVENLSFLYRALDEEAWPAEAVATAARKLVLLYSALQHEQDCSGNYILWQLKPKFHLMLELLEYVALQHGSPKGYWTYADEDFGGWLASLAKRRGGAKTPVAVALRLLNNATCIEKVEHLDM